MKNSYSFVEFHNMFRSNTLKILGTENTFVQSNNQNSLIVKKNKILVKGKEREISFPASEDLRKYLKLLSKKLEQDLPVHKSCTSKKGSSFIENASKHLGAVEILNLDIKDFYPNCKFLLNNYYNENENLEKIIRALNFDGLSVGFSTSPIIANHLMYIIDNDIEESLYLCCSKKLTITRYFDDITVSSKEPLTLLDKKYIFNDIQFILNQCGFEVNKKKTKWLQPGRDARTVTGVDLHTGQLNVPRTSIQKKVRPSLNRLANLSSQNSIDFNTWIHQDQQAAGYLSYIKQTNILQYSNILLYLEKRVKRNLPDDKKLLEYISHEYRSCNKSYTCT